MFRTVWEIIYLFSNQSDRLHNSAKDIGNRKLISFSYLCSGKMRGQLSSGQDGR
ncbi:MAG: hypothetical protein K6A82_03345 [Prevotella sp.]|nr:hypothetical protein [Prevotella sp.]